jgi:hypothetical protein
MTDLLGWVATAVFVGSYFFKRPALLRAAQMAGAALWIVYGALIGALPVVVANGLVFAAAAWTLVLSRGRLNDPARGDSGLQPQSPRP